MPITPDSVIPTSDKLILLRIKDREIVSLFCPFNTTSRILGSFLLSTNRVVLLLLLMLDNCIASGIGIVVSKYAILFDAHSVNHTFFPSSEIAVKSAVESGPVGISYSVICPE